MIYERTKKAGANPINKIMLRLDVLDDGSVKIVATDPVKRKKISPSKPTGEATKGKFTSMVQKRRSRRSGS